ncbi:uncharacterized protein LOC110981950 [Acanthaster planci]|uniref:Uncharacterized protein LOC110981950 n=1 Tax=Acanthaster planci TaxID=133434 RepID=A0A8B7YSM7_ACAPL|nr:uncharacterized protein LOC110981950 [Acanthaster planci]
MTPYHTSMLVCSGVVMMIIGSAGLGIEIPKKYYGMVDIVSSCGYRSIFTRSFGPSDTYETEATLVYSMIGTEYSSGSTCQYKFSSVSSSSLVVNAEHVPIGFSNGRSCLTFYQSSSSSFRPTTLLAKYCNETLFQVKTQSPYLLIVLSVRSASQAVGFRLVVTPVFESDGDLSNPFRCRDGSVISSNLVNDGHPNCPDKSDENDNSSFPCAGRLIPCGSESGPCIAKEWKCDRIPDCPNAEDEEGCVYKCPGSSDNGESFSEYECRDKSSCFSEYDRCRGHSYGICDDESENMDCDNCDDYSYSLYDESRFSGNGPKFEPYCPMTRTCMTVDKFCNGIRDCPNGADEDYNLCHPSIYWYWTPGQLAGVFIGFIIFVFIVVVIVIVVQKKCRKEVV